VAGSPGTGVLEDNEHDCVVPGVAVGGDAGLKLHHERNYEASTQVWEPSVASESRPWQQGAALSFRAPA
jgi:hypothetical protein